MRVLVLSDPHGYQDFMQRAISSQPDAEAVVFLGDGAGNFEACKKLLNGKHVYAVKGNNDFCCEYPKNRVITENGTNIYITHGHYEYVKSGLHRLLSETRSNGCTLALYGHTHIQKTDYVNGIYLFCPGALMKGEYGVVDLTDNGLICIGMKLR